MTIKAAALPLLIALAPISASHAAGPSAPLATPAIEHTPEAADTPYPGGTISLDVDATDVTRGLWRVTERIPVAPGRSRLTLLYPEWLPGKHRVYGAIKELNDIHFLADGKEIAWQRDPFNVFAFHLDLPEGTREVVARFIDTSPVQGSEGRITMTPEMLNLQWWFMSLYPAGHYVRQIRIQPSATFPEGWSVFTALDGKSQSGNRVVWGETSYQVLLDSPVFAGKHAKSLDLGHDVRLDVVADKPANLDFGPEPAEAYKRLVEQELATFGSRHFDHYDFLVALSDKLGGIGLEHHRSSENSMEPDDFAKWSDYDWDRDVLPHEFAHSWNGKFRRPAGLWTPDYRQKMDDSLLWMYEGQTQFWGWIFSARSGVRSKEDVLGYMAYNVGIYSAMPGREWRSLEDTTYDPIVARREARSFSTISRGEDYYNEGALVWLEADQIIRAGTGGKKGLDDFAKAFFGIRDGDWGEVTYNFDDIVAALNGVYPYDWAGFLKQRFYQPDQPAPLAGIEMGGYKLVWKDKPNPWESAYRAHSHTLSLYHSLGVTLDKNGNVTSCRWDSPAFDAGIVKGAKIVAVAGEAYDQDTLKSAIAAAKDSSEPVRLLVKRGSHYFDLQIDYHGGLRWPWLERTTPGEEPAPLDQLLAPRTTG